MFLSLIYIMQTPIFKGDIKTKREVFLNKRTCLLVQGVRSNSLVLQYIMTIIVSPLNHGDKKRLISMIKGIILAPRERELRTASLRPHTQFREEEKNCHELLHFSVFMKLHVTISFPTNVSSDHLKRLFKRQKHNKKWRL